VSPLTLAEAAALAGGHCWVERRLFEVLGAWSAHTAGADATLALDRHAQHAAWRAAQWWDRLPVLAGVDREALVAPGRQWRALDGPGLDDLVAASAAPDSTDTSAETDGEAPGGPERDHPDVAVLAVAYRVLLPRVVVAYARHLPRTSPLADGPVVRTLGQVRADAAADWAEGEARLQALLVDAAAVDAAAAAAAAAERRLVA
jgi:hypothetical protein